MRATPFEKALANLRGRVPKDAIFEYMRKEKAYEQLKKISGEDFGYDHKRWAEWGFWNEMFLYPPRFLRCLANLRRQIPSKSLLYYLSPEEAYEGLKELSGQDFGDDDTAWEGWGRQHGYIP